MLARRGRGKVICLVHPFIIWPSLILAVESRRLRLNQARQPPRLNAYFLKAPYAMTWSPAENFRCSWQSQLILLSLITTSSRAQQTFSVGARWSFQFVGYPASVTSIQPAIVGAEAAEANPERNGRDCVPLNESPGSRHSP